MADSTSSGTSSGTSQGTSVSSGGTYYSNPDLVAQLAALLQGQIGGAGENLTSFMQNPAASPLFQNQLSGLLAALTPSEQQATQQYTDLGRAAGNMSSGAFAQGAGNLQSGFMRNRQELASKLLGQTYDQTTRVLMQLLGMGVPLIDAMKLSQQASQSQQSSQQSSQQQAQQTGTQPAAQPNTAQGLLDQIKAALQRNAPQPTNQYPTQSSAGGGDQGSGLTYTGGGSTFVYTPPGSEMTGATFYPENESPTGYQDTMVPQSNWETGNWE